MKKIENLMNDLSIEIRKNENNQYILSRKNFNEIQEYSERELNENDFQIENQIHIKRDRDIKIDMKKIDSFNLKLIYHKKKDDSLEYRLFISYKDEENNLKRIRMINDKIKSIHSNKEKMIELFEKINKNQIEKYLNEKIS